MSLCLPVLFLKQCLRVMLRNVCFLRFTVSYGVLRYSCIYYISAFSAELQYSDNIYCYPIRGKSE